MTREHAILMLLATSPASRGELVQDTGWGILETNAVIDKLLVEQKVVFFPRAGNTRTSAKALCLPAARTEALRRHAGGRP